MYIKAGMAHAGDRAEYGGKPTAKLASNWYKKTNVHMQSTKRPFTWSEPSADIKRK